MNLYTAMIGYDGKDGLNISRKSGDICFAPTWDLVVGIKTRVITRDEYIKRYIKSMRISYLQNQDKWESIMNNDELTLMCYCKPFGFCHRYILVSLLISLNNKIVYCGERNFENDKRNGSIIKNL